MNKFKDFLENLYTTGNAMFYLYVAIAIVAVLLIIVVIINAIKAKKTKKNKTDSATLTAATNESELNPQAEQTILEPTPVIEEQPFVAEENKNIEPGPLLEPAPQPTVQPAQEPVVEPAPQPAVQPVQEPVVEPVTANPEINNNVYLEEKQAEPTAVADNQSNNPQAIEVANPVSNQYVEQPMVFPEETVVERPATYVEPEITPSQNNEISDNNVQLNDAEINQLKEVPEVSEVAENKAFDLPKIKEEGDNPNAQVTQVVNEEPGVMSPEEIKARLEQLKK